MNAPAAVPPLAFDPTIITAIADGAWVVFNLSSGKDSSAATFATMKFLDAVGHPRDRRLAIHADLGRAEWDATAAMVERIAALAGLPLSIVRRRAGDLIARWHQRFEAGKARYEALETNNLIGPWSNAGLRFCTSELKVQPIGQALSRMLRGATIINVLGIRHDESEARARAPIAKEDHRFAASGNAAGTRMLVWNPIVGWSSDDVFAAHAALGIPLHEAYTVYGSSRLSCRYCVLQSLADQRAAAAAPANREALIDLARLEARSTFSFQPTRWLGDVAPDLLPADLSEALVRAKTDARSRRLNEARLPAELRFQRGWPPRLPTMAEARVIADVRAPLLARHALANHYPGPRAVIDRFAELRARQAA